MHEPLRLTIEHEIDAAIAAIREATLIAVVRERAAAFSAQLYPSLLARITAPAPKPERRLHPEPTKTGPGFSEGPVHPDPPEPPEPRAPEYVSASSLRATYAEAFLASEHDVDAYLDTLRKTYVQVIRAGKRISV